MAQKYLRVALLFLICGCGRTAVPPETIPLPVPVSTTPAGTLSGSPDRTWTITPATQPQRYSSTASIILELISDSTKLRENITQQSRFSLLTGSASGSSSFLGSIESLTTQTPPRIGLAELSITFPVSFTGHIQNGTVLLDAINGHPRTGPVECSTPAFSALNVIHRNIVILPAQLVQGMTWRDSTSTAGCSGNIPVNTIAIRSYRVMGETELSGRSALLLEKTEKVSSSGEGSENQHRILIRTEGSGAGKIYIDRSSGALLSAESEQQINVTITAGRVQRFIQVVKEKTTLVDN